MTKADFAGSDGQAHNPRVTSVAPKSRAGAYACLALSMALVGVYVGLSPLLLAVFPVALLAWLRFSIGALVMADWLRRTPDDQVLTRREHILLFLQSLFGNFLFTLCALEGTLRAGVLSAGVIMASIPACVAILSRIFLSEPLTRRVWLAVSGTAMAVCVLALQRTGALADSPTKEVEEQTAWSLQALGVLLLLGAAFCEASYVVIGKRLSARVSPRRISAIINVWGLLLATPMGAWLALSFDFSPVPAHAWALLAFYSLAASVATVWLWMKGLQRVPAQTAGVFTAFLPLSSAAVGVGVLGEPWSAAHGLALMLTLASIWLVTRHQPSSPPAPPAPPV